MLKRVFLSFCLLITMHVLLQAETLVVATYNLRYANRGDSLEGNGWGQRCPYIAGLIRFQGFDIFGTQEGLLHQLQDLKKALPEYDYIGVGRDDGQVAGEHSAIFYRKDRFKLLEHGDFWLSTETDRPNKGWDAALPRICSWGKFKDKKSGFVFLFFNLHMDHVGVQARQESAKLVLRKVKEMGNMPVILTGDFNVDQTHESYRLLNTSGILQDAYETALYRYAPNGTFNAFHTDSKTDSRIDHLFLSDDFKVLKYGVLTNVYWAPCQEQPEQVDTKGNFPKELSLNQYEARIPSDHFPVMLIVEEIK